MMTLRALSRYALLFGIVIALAASCRSSSNGDTAPPTAAASVTRLSPEAFRDAIAAGGGFVVNVHVPYEGEIAGTDAFVPYNAIAARAAELPQDKNAPLLVYCRSGRMSAMAIPALQQLGYTRILELTGGMDAWRAAGLPIVDRPS